jgi:hypothetical protein
LLLACLEATDPWSDGFYYSQLTHTVHRSYWHVTESGNGSNDPEPDRIKVVEKLGSTDSSWDFLLS